jgi:large subunit ribosomal protein L35
MAVGLAQIIEISYTNISPQQGICWGFSFIEDVMPKLKTHKGAAKRFKKTGTGKVKRSHAFMRHILTSKSTKKKRHLDIDTLISKADEAKVKRMIPYD